MEADIAADADKNSSSNAGSASPSGDGNGSSAPNSTARLRDMRVFRPTDVPFDPRRLELPEDFYSPTVADVTASFTSLHATTKALDEAPLMTKKMRETQQARRISRFRKVLIRIRFPDRVSLQGTFAPLDKVRDVIKFVNSALREPTKVKYHLFVTPPKTVLKDFDSTLWSQGLVPAALLHVGIDSGESDSTLLLSDDALSMLEDTPPPGAAVFSTMAPPVEPEKTGKYNTGTAEQSRESSSSKQSRKSLPKWLKRK